MPEDTTGAGRASAPVGCENIARLAAEDAGLGAVAILAHGSRRKDAGRFPGMCGRGPHNSAVRCG